MKSRNINFDEEKRTSLSDSVVQALYDASFNSKYKEFIDYRQDQYIDWYTGISSVNDLPTETKSPINIFYSGKKYFIKTTAIKGSFSTPYFRQSLDEHMFEFDIENIVYIYVPANMSINNSLIIDIDMDIAAEMDDYLFIQIYIEYYKNNTRPGIEFRKSSEYISQNKKNLKRKYKIDKFSAYNNR